MKIPSHKPRKQDPAILQPKKKSGTKGTATIQDNRPDIVHQRKLKETMNNQPADKTTPIQQKANKTGLPDNLKTGIENLSGYAMDDVKVHYNSSKPAQLQAHAYAQGTDIHLASGQEKHLPHEAWHVVQQKQGRVQPTTQLKGKVNINDDAGLEKEADVMGAKALTKTHSKKVNGSSGGSLPFLNPEMKRSSTAQLVPKNENITLFSNGNQVPITYDTNNIIGQGADAIIYTATYNNIPVVVKVSKEGSETSMMLEIDHYERLSGQENLDPTLFNNIIKPIGYCDEDQDENVILVLERADHSLKDSLPRTLDERIGIILGLWDGLNKLHFGKTTHEDINQKNILVKNNTVKIADFGGSDYKQEILDVDTREDYKGFIKTSWNVLLGATGEKADKIPWTLAKQSLVQLLLKDYLTVQGVKQTDLTTLMQLFRGGNTLRDCMQLIRILQSIRAYI